jgi:hypothetical protein
MVTFSEWGFYLSSSLYKSPNLISVLLHQLLSYVIPNQLLFFSCCPFLSNGIVLSGIE